MAPARLGRRLDSLLRFDELAVEPHRQDMFADTLLVIGVKKVGAVAAPLCHLVITAGLGLRRNPEGLLAMRGVPAPPSAGLSGNLDGANTARIIRADGDAHDVSR